MSPTDKPATPEPAALDVEGLDVNDCPDCHGDGWTAETTADPDEFGEPGEPYQYQAECLHPALTTALREVTP